MLQGSSFVLIRVFFSLMVGFILTFQCWWFHTGLVLGEALLAEEAAVHRDLLGQDLSASRGVSLSLPTRT